MSKFGRSESAWRDSSSRYEQVLDLEHYLDVLERKPGALAGSSPLKQWRERGRWPESFDRLWQSLRERHGPQAGTRAMIELLGEGGTECVKADEKEKRVRTSEVI